MKKLFLTLTLLTIVLVLAMVVGCSSQNTSHTKTTYGPSGGGTSGPGASGRPGTSTSGPSGEGTSGGEVSTSETSVSESSGCPSPYDGTYSGTVSGSGEFVQYVNGEKTFAPYIDKYDLEVTLTCNLFNDYSNLWSMNISNVKVSDPYFDCTNGCSPTSDSSFVSLPPPGQVPKPTGTGYFIWVTFPNGRWLRITPIIAESDAKTIREDDSDLQMLTTESVLGEDDNAMNTVNEHIEYRLCPSCDFSGGGPMSQEGLTMILRKIS